MLYNRTVDSRPRGGSFIPPCLRAGLLSTTSNRRPEVFFMEIPKRSGFCECGCGRKTTIPKRTHSKLGLFQGVPCRFYPGHNARHTEEDRFWTKVNKDGPTPEHLPDLGPCWIWTGAISSHGYGNFRSRRHWSAYKFSFELENGPVQKGISELHKLDNTPCVNPSHLFLGTQLDNIRDCASKGRQNHWWLSRTHCKNGHLLSFDNWIRGKRQMICRACTRMYYQRYKTLKRNHGI